MRKIIDFKGEIIVVDNNSTDQTAKLAKSKGVRVVFEAINQISRARNTGSKEANGEYLIFVDADTRISQELLNLSLQRLKQEKCGGGGATIVFDTNQNQIFFGSFLPFFWSWLSKTFKLAAGSFIFCQKQLFLEAGGFSEKLFAGEEILFSIKLKRVCYRKGLNFEILEDYPVVTSSRKLTWFNPIQILIAILIPVLFPWALRSKRLCSFWYRRPLDK
jgi:glycosyltransferase involved in cell wall biosynthesis